MIKLWHKQLFRISRFYNFLFVSWESAWAQRWQANILIIVFLGGLFAIELARQGLLPTSLNLPRNHFYAVKFTFDLLLIIEILGLIFNLASSVASSMGKQFEIFSLILLRQSFKEFVHFPEPIEWTQVESSIQFIISDAIGGLLIFGLLGIFYALQKHRRITDNAEELSVFIAAKKTVALLLLIAFACIGFDDVWRWTIGRETYNFFDVFYTVLVFSDILLVLISLRYNSTYSVVFRNSGFAVATIILRLALTAPPFANVLLGLTAITLSIGLTYVYNRLSLFPAHSEITQMFYEQPSSESENQKSE